MCKLTQYMKIVTKKKKLKADEIPDSYNWWKLYTANLIDPTYNTKEVKESLERYKEDGSLDGIYHLLWGWWDLMPTMRSTRVGSSLPSPSLTLIMRCPRILRKRGDKLKIP